MQRKFWQDWQNEKKVAELEQVELVFRRVSSR
jgi:hypothetical protein